MANADCGICLVIPTMKRRDTSFDYIRKTFECNIPVYKAVPNVFASIYVYAHHEDESELKTYMNGNESLFKFIERADHSSALLGRFEKDTYAYWRTHLCMDFVSSMSAAMENDTESKYFMWLEDDTKFIEQTPTVLATYISRYPDFKWTCGGGIGGTCILFERSVLTQCLSIIRGKWYDDIPLDWMYRYFPKSECPPLALITKHLGTISSRTDSVIIRH